MEVTFYRIFMKPMNSNITRNFSGWWAILFIIISFFIIPIPFDIAFSYLGDWAYQNPVSVEIVFGEVTLYPIKDNLLQIFSMTSAVLFIIWIMKVLNIPLSALGSLEIQRKDLFFGLIFLASFIVLEEFYMLLLGIQMPEGFITFMLSDPIILGLISVVIIAPLAEEFLFRGFLYSQLSRTVLGGWGAIIFTSFIWTIIHSQYELLILVVVFIFGLFLGYIRFAYNSLALPIALHAVNNLFAFFMAYYFF